MKNAAFVILSVALGGWIVSCEKQDVKPKESLSLEVRRDSIKDFSNLLEGISLLVSDQPVTLRIPGGQGERKLIFSRLGDFPGCPVMVRVSPDSIFIGDSRAPATLDEVREMLRLLNEAATSAKSPSLLVLHSERHVSGEFGLSVLEVLADSGVDYVVLMDPKIHEKTPPSGSERPEPKPPYSGPRVVPLRQ